MNSVAVVILNWNGIGFLRKFLGNVVRYSSMPGCTVWVADNGSDDGSAEWAEKEFPGVRVMKFSENLGYAGGYARALSSIEACYFVLLNSDVEVTEGWLERLIEPMEKENAIAACQPKILSYGDRTRFEYAGAAGGYIDKYGYPFCRGRILGMTETDTGQYDTPAVIFWASGACLAIRASAYREAGGLEPSFFAHMEEIDLCWRLNRLGHRVMVIPSSVIYHVGGGTLSYETPGKTYLNFRNNLYMLYRNLPRERFRRTLFLRKCLDGAAALIYLLSGRFRHFAAVMKAHRDYYRAVPELRRARTGISERGLSEDVVPGIILNKSIVVMFYLRRIRRFTDIKL